MESTMTLQEWVDMIREYGQDGTTLLDANTGEVLAQKTGGTTAFLLDLCADMRFRWLGGPSRGTEIHLEMIE